MQELRLLSKTKTLHLLLHFPGLWQETCCPVCLQTLHVNGPVRFHRTGVFAGPATHAEFRVQFRNAERLPPVAGVRNHLHSQSRTVFGTGPATLVFGSHHAEIPDKAHLPGLDAVLLFQRERGNRPSGTHFGAAQTVVIAVTQGKIQTRDQKVPDAVLVHRRPQNLRWTDGHAELAACAAAEKALS